MKCIFVIACLFLLTNSVLASYEPTKPNYQTSGEEYQTLARGSGVIEPPYQETFEYLLVSEPGWLHFVFSYPLDPGQAQEVEEYQDQFHLNWKVCGLEIAGQPWTAISMPVEDDNKNLITSFLQHLRRFSFFVSLN